MEIKQLCIKDWVFCRTFFAEKHPMTRVRGPFDFKRQRFHSVESNVTLLMRWGYN